MWSIRPRIFSARVTTTWLVTSEGTIVRKSAAEYQEALACGDAGRRWNAAGPLLFFRGNRAQDLEARRMFSRSTRRRDCVACELRKAPLVDEEYHGPLLLSADAGADTMRTLLAGAVVATRPKLGTEARTNGPFASSYHARVLPEFMDVVDDPRLKSYGGKGLLGAYDVDDEGVAAQAVKLVKDAAEAGELPALGASR
jgi:predicted Zn-dependent protease